MLIIFEWSLNMLSTIYTSSKKIREKKGLLLFFEIKIGLCGPCKMSWNSQILILRGWGRDRIYDQIPLKI